MLVAILVASGVNIRHNIIEGHTEVELSPQDILDHVWFYFKDERQKKQDPVGCFKCKHSIAYRFVEEMEVGLLENYPMVYNLNKC